MRVCDFLNHFKGNFIVKFFIKDDVYRCYKEGTLEDMNDECNKSFNPLDGFNNKLWEENIKEWSIIDNVIVILTENLRNE